MTAKEEYAKIYKVQIKVLWFWITIKEFDGDDYYDAVDCFRVVRTSDNATSDIQERAK